MAILDLDCLARKRDDAEDDDRCSFCCRVRSRRCATVVERKPQHAVRSLVAPVLKGSLILRLAYELKAARAVAKL
jgi:hypothetical protein